MTLAKAIIEILDQAAIDPARGLPKRIEVQFNPAEYSLNTHVRLSEKGLLGGASPMGQFVRGTSETLALDLFFDTTEQGMADPVVDVRTLTGPIYQLTQPQPQTHTPPRVLFSWGPSLPHAGGLAFKAIVERVQQRFTLFSPLGTPLRALVSVTFRAAAPMRRQAVEQDWNLTAQRRKRVVQQGDTLAAIAAEAYGDPSLWRRIVERNPNIVTNPRRLSPGAVLEIGSE